MHDLNPYASPQQESLDRDRTVPIKFRVDDELLSAALVVEARSEGWGRWIAGPISFVAAVGVLLLGNFLLPWDAIGRRESTSFVAAVFVMSLSIGAALLPGFVRYHLILKPWARGEVQRLRELHDWLRPGIWLLELRKEQLVLRTPAGTVAWRAKEVKHLQVETAEKRLHGAFFLRTPDVLVVIPLDAGCDDSYAQVARLINERCATLGILGWR